MTARRGPGTVLLFASFAMLACEEMPAPAAVESPAFARTAHTWRPDLAVASRYLEDANEKLAAQGAAHRVQRAEWVAKPGADLAAGSVVFANDRTLRLDTRWVPGDARRLADGDNITYATFLPAAFAAGVAGSAAPLIDAALDTWASVRCSNLPIVKRTLAPNVVPSALLVAGGFVNDPFAADIANLGWIPGEFFDLFLGPGARDFVLGVTFTFAFPTDIDGDGRADTAAKEIWYNADLTWSANGGPTDVETVALHENGHALELGHFGKIHGTLANLKLHVSPRAVMNAIILGTLRQPLGSDVAGYCGNFASWPN